MQLWQEWIVEAQKGVINVQQCKECRYIQFYPRDFCLECSSKKLKFVATDGSGVVFSYTQIHRSPNPEIFIVPYYICLVEIAKNIMIICNVAFKDDTAEIGREVFFRNISNDGIIYYSD
jgi:uncharacterized OB-fold protein